MAEASAVRDPSTSFAKRLAIAVAVVAFVALTAKVLLVLFAGVLLALIFRGVADWIAKKLHVRYGIVVAVVVVAFVAIVAIGSALLAPAIGDQLAQLRSDLPRAFQELQERVRHLPVVAQSAGAKNLGPEAKSVAAGAIAAVGTSVEVLGAFAVVFFVGVYGAAQPGVYVRAALAVCPDAHRERARHALEDAGHNLTRWLFGRLVAMLFVGVTCCVGFAIMKVPLATTLGILAGLLTFVEYIGAVASGIPPTLLAFTKSPALALGVVILFTVLHILEGYVLTPLLARASVRIPPAFALAGQVLLAALVGPLGLTFATPLLVVLASAIRAWRSSEKR
ncbi:MAG TPA: AI-2E family transporter [Labilithrix sp.]|jgi:predicted PurR-regulated permease PerM